MLYTLNENIFSVEEGFLEAKWFAMEEENEFYFFLQDKNSSAIRSF